ncbi:hypothetical protein DPMN_174249 [Dreissena polymorpha]|uniref:Uncharacterized protein n=1 Tax=Dreissena polymorpha TaxID=45954 RepID=A0A9D4E330_DREPO|nr:hypothetical protein DPMN_174249 [Dreissena polymorpha]
MGKTGSKHECFLVNAHLNKAWEDQIWKKTTKTGYNLANYNMNQSMSAMLGGVRDVAPSSIARLFIVSSGTTYMHPGYS